MKTIRPITGCVLFILLTVSWACAQEDVTRLDNSGFTSPQRPGAVFEHDEHNAAAGLEDDCSICHHVYANNQKVEDESSEDSPCSECHALKPGPDNSVSLRRAFHVRCRSCHITQKQGPVLCGQCHIKKRGS